MDQTAEHLSITEQWSPALENLFLTSEEDSSLDLSTKEQLLSRLIDERSTALMKMPENYPSDPGSEQPLFVPPQPVLARWTVPFLLSRGYEVEQVFDVDKIAAANEVVGHPGGDWLLRRMEQRISEMLNVTETLQKSDELPERLLISVGGDEYMIMQRDNLAKDKITIEEINNSLTDVKIAFKSRDKNVTQGVEWHPVHVKGTETSEVQPYDQDQNDIPPYEKLYQTIFNIDEDAYSALSTKVKVMMKESLLDPVLSDHQVLKSADDALEILRGNNPQMDHCTAFTIGVNGLKEANTQNRGDQFLRDVYSGVQEGAALLSEQFGIDKNKIQIVRNRGATFIFFIDATLSSEQKFQLESVLKEHVGKEQQGILVFPGIAYQEDLKNSAEVVPLIDITERRQNLMIMKALLENLRSDTTSNNRKLMDTLRSYFNDPKRGSRRRKGMSETIINLYYIYQQLGKLPEVFNTLERWQSEYGDRRSDLLREGPFEDIDKLALYLHVPYNSNGK